MKRMYSSLSRSALALAVASIFGFMTMPAEAQNPKACLAAVGHAAKASGLPAKAADPRNIATACKRARERPALAMRDLTHHFVMAAKLDAAPPAKPEVAKQCPGRLAAVSKALRINPKFANPNDIKTACGRAKGRPVMAARNFLDRFVVTAKLGPSVIGPQKPTKPVRPTGHAACNSALMQVSKALAVSPKFANPNDINTACGRVKGNPVLASANFLDRFVKTAKVSPAKPAPAALAKSCQGRLTAVSKTLRVNPKFANPKDVHTACGRVKGHPALAARNFLGRYIAVNKIK